MYAFNYLLIRLFIFFIYLHSEMEIKITQKQSPISSFHT